MRNQNPRPTDETLKAHLAPFADGPAERTGDRAEAWLVNLGFITPLPQRTVRPAQHRFDGTFTMRPWTITDAGRAFLETQS